MSACWPLVLPGLPPTGMAGVGSLRPTPGASWLSSLKSAAWAAGTDARTAPITTARMDLFTGHLLGVLHRLAALVEGHLALAVDGGGDAAERFHRCQVANQ